MGIKKSLKEFYFFKIKKWTVLQYRIYRFRKMGMNIGEDPWIFSDGVETAEPYLVTIGNHVMIANEVHFTTHDASASYFIPGASDIFGRINIGDNVFIGMGSIILPGVTIADNCIIGAGSVVTKSFLKEGGVIAGNPARLSCSVDDLNKKYEGYDLNTWNVPSKKDYLLQNENKFKVANAGD